MGQRLVASTLLFARPDRCALRCNAFTSTKASLMVLWNCWSTEPKPLGSENPYDPNTIVGPMIASQEADRAEGWIHEAVEQGANVLRGARAMAPFSTRPFWWMFGPICG